MNKTTGLMVAVLAVSTILTAGLAILPASVEEAHTDIEYCTNVNDGGDNEADINCDNNGPLEIEEGLPIVCSVCFTAPVELPTQ
jgi:hypothetical protein